MKKRFSSKNFFKKGLALVLCSAMAMNGMPWEAKSISNDAVKAASNVAANANTSAVTTGKQIKNIIYMIPDGGGYPSYDMTKAVKEAGGLSFTEKDGNFTGTKITAKKMYLEEYHIGSAKTKSNNNDVTDSAAAGTALATGKKTNNGYVGVDANYRPMANLQELAQLEGKSVGLAVTCYQYDATPAAFSCHTGSRGDNAQLIKQMAHGDLNVLLGGGINYHVGNSTEMIKNQGYTLVGSESELANAAKSATAGSKIWATFHSGAHHLPYDHKYGYNYDNVDDTAKKTPTLAEMTQQSIDILEEDPDGFFLMVEGSKIDYGCHHGKASEYVGDYIAFDEAFHVAVEYAKKRTDTAVIAVPDHNTGVTSIPTGNQLNDAINSVKNGGDPTNGFTFSSSSAEYPHSGHNVGVWMYLPEGVSGLSGLSSTPITSISDRDKYVVDNTEIPKYVASLMSDMTLEDATGELFMDVTDKGSYNNDKFTFRDKNVSVEINTDIATVDGKTVDLDGHIAIWSGNKCYMSKKSLQKIGILEAEVPVEPFAGKGTKAEPYLIQTETEFLAFTNKIKSGETYAGKYFKQKAHLNMENVSGYAGLSGAEEFKGNYNGQGYTINAKLSGSVEKGIAIFPYVSGTILNLGTKGSIANTHAEGGVAGIARSIRDGGCIVNCWSTMELTSKKDAGAITLSVRGTATMYNCYYKGKITTKTNYGMGMTSDSPKVVNCYYAMDAGSTAVGGSGSNEPLGKASSDFKAATLNGYHAKAVSDIAQFTSKDEFCNFVDLTGQAFGFAGSSASLSSMSYTYTTLTGQKKTVEVENFKPEQTGYDVKASEDLDVSKAIVLSGVPVKNTGNETIKEASIFVDEKGFATGEVRVSSSVKTTYYETTATNAYNINLAATLTGNVTPIPTATEVPKNMACIYYNSAWDKTYIHYRIGEGEWTKVPGVAMEATTEYPGYTHKIELDLDDEAGVTVCFNNGSGEWDSNGKDNYSVSKGIYGISDGKIKTLEKLATATPAVTATPEVTVAPTPNVTSAPAVTATPIATSAPAVTATPDVTTSPSVTATPVAEKKSLKNCVVTGVKKSYTYTRAAIKPGVRVKDGGHKLVKNLDYTVSYTKNKNSGTAKITLRGIGNYIGTKTISFKITKKDIKGLKVAKIKNQTYKKGKPVKPNVVIKYGTYKLKKGTDYRVVFKNNKKKGKATVTIYGKGNYTGKKKVTFKIK